MQNVARTFHDDLPTIAHDRRKSHRTRTVYRVARVQANGDEGLAHIRNISDDGMKITLGIPVMLGDRVRVFLSDTVSVEGEVVWRNGYQCGLKFPDSIDSIGVLRGTAEEIRSGEARPPRLATELKAVVSSEIGLRPARVRDISQRGMKLVHDGSFTPGLTVKVILGSGIERRGFVRWVNGNLAGVMLTEMLSVQDLEKVSAL